MNVVLIEDDLMLLRSLEFFLKSKNYRVIPFDNGLDAINHLKEQAAETDLIITDLNLPFAGGQQVIHEVRQLSEKHIPVIVLTSSGVESTELEVFDLGADDFVSKPFSPAVLLRRIEKLLT